MRVQGTSAGMDHEAKSGFAMFSCLAVILVSFIGCSSQNKDGEFISTHLSICSYAEARHHADPTGKESRFYFPILEVYNQGGALLYVRHESTTNAQVLKKFPFRNNLLPF